MQKENWIKFLCNFQTPNTGNYFTYGSLAIDEVREQYQKEMQKENSFYPFLFLINMIEQIDGLISGSH